MLSVGSVSIMKMWSTPGFLRSLQPLSALFFLSGATSLVFEAIFTRLMTYTFGNTAQAVSTVLAVFLGGLSVGAFVVGRLADRRPPSLRLYGALELLVGAYCLLVPSLFGVLTRAYVNLYNSFGVGTLGLTALRFGIALPLIVPAAFLMGGTLPAVARFVASQGSGFQARLDRLYALNCLGVWLSCGIDFAIFASVMALTSRSLQPVVPVAAFEPPISEPERAGRALSRSAAWVLLGGSFLTGAVALAYEVTWTHVLAFLIGNSVYAFGLMLFVFLCGLGWGARWVGRRLQNVEDWAWALGLSQLALGLVILLTLPLWTRVHDLFSYGVVGAYDFDLAAIGLLVAIRVGWLAWRTRRNRPLSASGGLRTDEHLFLGLLFCAFVATAKVLNAQFDFVWFFWGELLRLLITSFLLIVPATLLGFSFPLFLNLYTHGGQRAGRRVGRIYAANTLGTVVGSLATGFFFLPSLGSLSMLRTAALASALLGFGLAFWLETRQGSRRKAMLAGLAVLCSLLFALTPRQWDETRMSRGAYAYFNPGWRNGRVVYFKEDIEGGLTSVGEAGKVRTLLTNGKFQGDNAEEVPQQFAFAFIPALFVRQFNHALVIGLGTGGTLRGVCDLPFRRIDAAELSPHIVEAARLWFRDVNREALGDSRVHIKIADGRNYLLLSREHYDLITIEVTSLWISGQADLYNKEFYELCRAHLGEDGVLQQWVAIHHLRTRELLVILNTAAQVFPHLAFFMGSSHGLLIASSGALGCEYSQIQNLGSSPEVARDLQRLGVPSMWSLFAGLMLEDKSMRRLLSAMPQLAGLSPGFVSSDLFPDLEYQSPKGITLPYDTASRNLELLMRFRPKDDLLPGIAIRGQPSDNDRELVLGYIAEARGDKNVALKHFGRLSGPSRNEADAETARIRAGIASADGYRQSQ
ncbi:MAG: hypothetical protein DMG21_17185 [Acidobacteria bacterium]|nr:MAG: hypothetical protein DMG21_17185 [Acidobacteriota bacterium]